MLSYLYNDNPSRQNFPGECEGSAPHPETKDRLI